MSNTWRYGAGYTEVLIAQDGRILGQVSRAIGTGWYATYEEKSIGKYYTSDDAKKAIEAKVEEAS